MDYSTKTKVNNFFDGKSIAITGGTGSLGAELSRYLIENTELERLVVISRRWQDQKRLQRELGDNRLRFFIGDVREKDRMIKALNDVDYVFNCAAFKDVVLGQYNPEEIIRTNILGSANVFDAAIVNGVERVLSISSDKACAPLNIYGSSKNVMEHMSANWSAYGKTKFAISRYGNVLGSSGSVLPLFKEQAKLGRITLTNYQATRFWITMYDAVKFVVKCMANMSDGLVYVPKLKSSYVYDLAEAVAPHAAIEEIGLRPGEKLHEVMISKDESRLASDLGWCYAIYPSNYQYDFGGRPYEYKGDGKEYSSFNAEKYTVEELREMIQ